MGNDWFHEYFINELKAIGRKPTSNMQHEVVDSLPSSGNEQTIYFVKNDSSSSNNHYDEYVWISSSSTFEKIGSSQIDGSAANPDWNQNDATQPDYVKNRPFYTGNPVETVLVEATTVAFADDGGGIYMGTLELPSSLIVGQTHTISWDGVTYESTSVDFGGYVAIGNVSMTGEGSDTGEPFLILGDNNGAGQIATLDTASSHTISISRLVSQVVKIDAKYLPIQFKPEGASYLTFSSPNNFTLSMRYESHGGWDGTIEYFSSNGTWTTWHGGPLSAVANYGEYVMYLRGIGNSRITPRDYEWDLIGTDIKCIGNIENLLDYTTVESGNHPIMADSCYSRLFSDCTALTQAPALPATTLANRCYSNMFAGCTALTQAPALPATTLANDCYSGMFSDCTALTQAPVLPATTLANGCYTRMFSGCTALTQAPVLPVTTLADSCYSGMFSGCTALTQAPALPVTTLANDCYSGMFSDCTALTQAPALPATTLADSCYSNMFTGCTALTQAPALPATTLANRCYSSMFEGCTSLKLSSTKTDEYKQEYRIPSSGDGVTANDDLTFMFSSTGGTFTGTPSINTIYYLSSDNMIVRETEIATLNGYVDSMINTALSKIGVAEEGAY